MIPQKGHYWGLILSSTAGAATNRPVPVYYQGDSSEVLDGLVGEGYESYGSKVPGIVCRPNPHLSDHMMLLQKGQHRFSPIPKSEAEAPAESPFQFAAAGGDLLKADTDEIIFGGDGDDFLDASTGGGNTLYGRDANDILFVNDLLLGENGDDALFAGTLP